ncbi:glycosyltransferase [Vibrio sp. ECSMB14106]|uniref:glycosyltransferase n=1 Tax=Vibrio sp. ECSMB14106 TaxID=1638949 RepID=UPI0006960830|nr:glycosyltransferase [Vibrio sp. ECSMB14106]
MIDEKSIKSSWNYEDIVYASIVCVTYNQDCFLEKTLKSLVEQRSNYRFEIIIHDDASTDNTTIILNKYKEKYPSIIKVIRQKENQYSKGGFRPLYYASSYASGKYLAFCEGDDYWINNEKLNKQVEILENDGSVSLVHTNYLELRNNIEKKRALGDSYPISTVSSLLKSNTVGTLTACFRREDLIEFTILVEEESKEWRLGDLPLWLYLSGKGDITYLKEEMAVYRVLNESASHSKNKNKKLMFILNSLYIKLFFIEYYKLSFSYKVRILIGALRNLMKYPTLNKEVLEFYMKILKRLIR